MRILILIHSLQAGGAERVSVSLANIWSKEGHSVTLATWDKGSDFYMPGALVSRRSLGLASRSETTTTAFLANVRRIIHLRKLLKEQRIEVVLAMMYSAGTVATIAALGLPCRVLVSERAYPGQVKVRRLWAVLRRITYPLASSVIVQTQDGLDWLKNNIAGARGTVIENYVSLPLDRSAPHVSPDDVLPKGGRMVLAVGRLDEQKGFDLLIDSFASIADEVSQDWHLLILGEGAQREELERRLAKLPCKHRVLMPGRVGNISDWYAKADLFVLSSRFEGFPNTLLEAMAHGCPAVSFNCMTGPRDIVRHGIDGLLVDPASGSAGLARAMRCLMEDESKRRSFGLAAKLVLERFSQQSVMQKWNRALCA